MIAEFARRTPCGHREVRQDTGVKLWFGELDRNGRGCSVLGLCSHGFMASLEDG